MQKTLSAGEWLSICHEQSNTIKPNTMPSSLLRSPDVAHSWRIHPQHNWESQPRRVMWHSSPPTRSFHTSHSSPTWIRGCRSVIALCFSSRPVLLQTTGSRLVDILYVYFHKNARSDLANPSFLGGEIPLSNSGRDKCHPQWGVSWFSSVTESSLGMTSCVVSRPHLSISSPVHHFLSSKHPCRGVLLAVVRHAVWSSNIKNVETMARVGPRQHKKTKKQADPLIRSLPGPPPKKGKLKK